MSLKKNNECCISADYTLKPYNLPDEEIFGRLKFISIFIYLGTYIDGIFVSQLM